MSGNTRPVVPRTVTGWVAVALGLGVFAVIGVTYVVGNVLTRGGETMLPIWQRFVVFGAIVLVAVPATIQGRKARTSDPSRLGSALLITSTVAAAWFLLTGLLSVFFE